MPNRPITQELAKQFAAQLSVPIFIVDQEGTLLFYNKSAETILGRQFGESLELSSGVWSRIFYPTDVDGVPILPDKLPLVQTLREQSPVHDKFWIRGIDNIQRHIEVTTFPIMN